jgi:hypothetical protein
MITQTGRIRRIIKETICLKNYRKITAKLHLGYKIAKMQLYGVEIRQSLIAHIE